jgi:ABC-type sugar transport system permease subunit
MIGALKSFEFIFALTEGGPLPERSTETLGILLYRNANGPFGYGYNSATGVVMSIIVIAFTLLYMFGSKFSKEDGI